MVSACCIDLIEGTATSGAHAQQSEPKESLEVMLERSKDISHPRLAGTSHPVLFNLEHPRILLNPMANTIRVEMNYD